MSFLPTRGKISGKYINCHQLSINFINEVAFVYTITIRKVLLQTCLTTKRKRNMQSLIIFGKLFMTILTLLFLLCSCGAHATGKYITLVYCRYG